MNPWTKRKLQFLWVNPAKRFWASVSTFPALQLWPLLIWRVECHPRTDTQAWNTFKVRHPGTWKISTSSRYNSSRLISTVFPENRLHVDGKGGSSRAAACCSAAASPLLPCVRNSCLKHPAVYLHRFAPASTGCLRLQQKTLKINKQVRREGFYEAGTGFTWKSPRLI